MKASVGHYAFALLVIFILFFTCMLVSPAREVPVASPTPGKEINLAATTELEFALLEITTVFQQKTGNKINCVFGSNQKLAREIESGMAYDLLATTNNKLLHDLEKKNPLTPKNSVLYARGRIVLVANRKAGGTVNTLNDLLTSGVKHISIPDPESDPYGMAAREALKSTHLWEQVQSKLIYAEDSQQALQIIQNGDAEGGIVAMSVINESKVTWTLIDSSLYQPLDQMLTTVSDSSNTATIFSFMLFIKSKDAQDILRKHGFILPGDLPDFVSDQP